MSTLSTDGYPTVVVFAVVDVSSSPMPHAFRGLPKICRRLVQAEDSHPLLIERLRLIEIDDVEPNICVYSESR